MVLKSFFLIIDYSLNSFRKLIFFFQVYSCKVFQPLCWQVPMNEVPLGLSRLKVKADIKIF